MYPEVQGEGEQWVGQPGEVNVRKPCGKGTVRAHGVGAELWSEISERDNWTEKGHIINNLKDEMKILDFLQTEMSYCKFWTQAPSILKAE